MVNRGVKWPENGLEGVLTVSSKSNRGRATENRGGGFLLLRRDIIDIMALRDAVGLRARAAAFFFLPLYDRIPPRGNCLPFTYLLTYLYSI